MTSLSQVCLALVVLGLAAGCANPSNQIASIAEKETATPRAIEKVGASQGKISPSKGAADHDRRMDIVNQTGRTIQHFFATNSSIKKWGRDLLGDAVIPPGKSYRFDFNDGTGHCSFDFRAVLDNGRAVERYDVNVCRATAWILRAGAGEQAGPQRGDSPSPAQPGTPKTAPKRDPSKREIGA